MVLSGTLKEFILADVFQLLTQQKITGKLILNDGRSDGVVVFKNGLIVGAETEDEKFITKLSMYLTEVKLQPPEIVKGHISSFEDDIDGLTKDIIAKELLTKNEMTAFGESVLEDIICSLFQWKHGTYQFNSLRTVDSFTVCDISFPIENVVMEAMRRVDEWNRMITVISEDMIFKPDEKPSDITDELNPDPIKLPAYYLFTKIDGKLNVKQLFQTTCLTQYKVYEALATLLQSHKISALSMLQKNTVNEAASQTGFSKEHPLYAIIVSSLITVTVILVMLLFSEIFYKGIIFQKKTISCFLSNTNVPIKIAKEDKLYAELFYKSEYFKDAVTEQNLHTLRLISSKDMRYLRLEKEFLQKVSEKK
ncbi:MAG: DUF4388 domain-containing protein [Fibrobacter sp.]|nr:DUF4388 domain-containing protein [Fibrobacter sp.]